MKQAIYNIYKILLSASQASFDHYVAVVKSLYITH